MSALTDYYDLLLPELPGCPTAMLDLHLVETVRIFCASTAVWREALTPINLQAGVATYAMAVPAGSALDRLTSLTVNGELLWKLTSRLDDRQADGVQPKYTENQPPFQLSANLDSITLLEVPSSNVTAGLAITAALKPVQGATVIPDFIKSQYSEAIRHGVLSRLMAMGKKPWTDRELALVYSSRWNSALGFSAYQSQIGNTREPLRVKKVF